MTNKLITNIFRVLNENDLEEIFRDNPFKLIVVAYITKTIDDEKIIKKCLLDMASTNPLSIFVYIDMDDYVSQTQLDTSELPLTKIFIYNRELFAITGLNTTQIKQTFTKAFEKSKDITERIQQQQQQMQRTQQMQYAPQVRNTQQYNNFTEQQIQWRVPNNEQHVNRFDTVRAGDNIHVAHTEPINVDAKKIPNIMKTLEIVKKSKEILDTITPIKDTSQQK